MRSKIIGTGSYLPERVITNGDWEQLINTSNEWIIKRTGIRERHFAAPGESTSDMITRAARSAIEDAGINKNEIEVIIVGTLSPDHAFPSTGNCVQKKLDLEAIPSFDLSAACSGFLYGLIVADSLIKSGVVKIAMVAGAEVMSRILNWEDRSTCILFGDGAGVAILKDTENENEGILSSYWSADGRLGNLLIQPAGGSVLPASEKTVAEKLHTVHMKGNEVYKHAVARMEDASMKAIELANMTIDDIDLFIPHQANYRIIESTIKRVHIPLEKTYINVDKTANMSGASIPVALDEARRAGRIKPGYNVLMTSFGAGLTWCGMVLKFNH